MNEDQLKAVAALWDVADEIGDEDGDLSRGLAIRLADALFQITRAFPPDHPIHQVKL